MKKIFTASFCTLLLAGIISINSCSKDPLVIPFTIADKEKCLSTNPFQAYAKDSFDVLKADVLAVMSAAGITDVGRVTKAGLKAGGTFKVVVSGSGFTTLDDIANIEVYMKKSGTTGDGTQIAYSDAIGSGANEVKLVLNGIDMKQFVEQNTTFTTKILNKTTGNAQGCLTLTGGVIEISVKQ